MNQGVDTNVLVYAHHPASEHHEVTRTYLEDRLAHARNTVVVTPQVLAEFVHVVTDSRRLTPALSMGEALSAARDYLGRSNVRCAEISESIVYDAFELLEQHRLGRYRIIDTILVATLLHHDVTELITCNPGDFTIFTGLRIVDPRES